MKLLYNFTVLTRLVAFVAMACLAVAQPAAAQNTFTGLASLETYGINADFEDPELAHADDAEAFSNGNIGPGWTLRVIDGNSSNFGVQDPNQTYYGFIAPGGDLIAPFQGRQIGFVNTDSAATAEVISKSLGTIQPGQNYMLNVAVGVRTGGGGGTPWSEAYAIGLRTLGGVELGTFTNSGIMAPGATQDLVYNLPSAAAAAFVGQEVEIVIRSHNTQPAAGFSQANFDNVRLNGMFGEAVFPTITIDRATGNVSLNKTGPNLTGFNGYELLSDAGSFDSSGWLSIADNYDNGGSVDSNDQWTELSGSGTRLAEAEINLPPGNGGTLSGAVNLGNAWLRTPFEDVTGRLLTTDGVERAIQVQYVGNPIPVGDLNGDSMITVADWTLFKAGQGSSFAGLSDARAYLLGDLNNDFEHDLRDFITFRTAFNAANGAGAFEAQIGAVPEPATALLLTTAALSAALVLCRRTKLRLVPATAALRIAALAATVGLLACADTASAGRKADRLYTFGDDNLEGNTAPGLVLGTAPGNTVAGATLDSVGMIGQDFQDLQVPSGAAPTYASVSSGQFARPGTQSGDLGASFNGGTAGAMDRVQTAAGSAGGFNHPPLSNSSTLHAPPGTFDWTSIVNRGFQLWVFPNGPNAAANVQHVVHDTDEHGFRISAGGNWEMRYNSQTFNTGVPVEEFGRWYHVMSVIPHGTSGVAAANNTDGEVLYVDGVAVGAIGGGYDLTTTGETPNGELMVGANLAGTDNFFNGVLDELEVFGWGRTATGMDYGRFNLAEDNWFVAAYLAGFTFGDIDRSGGAIGQEDINALVAGYGTQKVINNVRVGDITTYADGDLNFDGITDLADVNLMIEALPGAGSGAGLNTSALFALVGGVPEPSSMVLAAMCGAWWFGTIRRRRA